MGVDVAPRPAPAVAVERVGQKVHRPHAGVALHQLLQAIEIEGEGFEQGGKIGGVPLAGDEAFAKADVGRGQHPAHEAVVVNDQTPLRARLGSLDPYLPARREDEGHVAGDPVLTGDADSCAKGGGRLGQIVFHSWRLHGGGLRLEAWAHNQSTPQ